MARAGPCSRPSACLSVVSALGETKVAKTSLIAKALKKPRFAVQAYTRCRRCGRSRGYLRKFEMCRICFRQLALAGEIPGVVKASW